MSTEALYWFPAKRFGWGWGLPIVWQGWAVIAAFAALVLLGAVNLLPSRGSLVFVAYAAILCVALVCVCWLKGEPPRWHGRAK